MEISKVMSLKGRLSLTLAILKPDLMARPKDAEVHYCIINIYIYYC